LNSIIQNKTYPKKHLGQNYLVDENISKKIVNSFSAKPEEAVLEIGPGKGALTKYLFKCIKNVIAVELDKNNCALLKKIFPGLNIINEDILKINFRKILNTFFYHSTFTKLRVIGNIPYNITSEILFKLIDIETKNGD